MSEHTTRSGDQAGATADPDEMEWSRLKGASILLVGVLTRVGMALASGVIQPVVDTAATADDVTVPSFGYLYAGLGALGYIFTELMVQFESDAEWRRLDELVGMGLRIPAAWILATGGYLFIWELGQASGDSSATFAAGVAFLVGLYVFVALKMLGRLADRMLGSSARPSAESEAAQSRPDALTRAPSRSKNTPLPLTIRASMQVAAVDLGTASLTTV